MSEIRLIKKYPNRRLYDTGLSKYVTLSHVRELVLEGLDIKVVDAETEEDITRHILMQIINEQENGESPLFSTDLLARFIRMYKDVVPGVFGEFLAQNLDLYLQQQEMYQKQMEGLLGKTPSQSFAELTQQNLELWKQAQQNFLDMIGMGDAVPKEPKNPGTDSG